MSRRDRVFSGTVKATISGSLSESKPKLSAAHAARSARFRPQNSRRNLQPISVHGVKCAENSARSGLKVLRTLHPLPQPKVPSRVHRLHAAE